ncbi:PIF1-like protein [Mya arenaria]|uniref:PIF1-like protein n=1 Tax=Mya arenaria TaxID=6604 RepID=A0ABY7DS67_MYAAR|nr:PIF1-like protein [Mya arenaria]
MNELLKRGDAFVCTCCQQTFYQHSVYTVARQRLMNKGISKEFLDKVLTNYKSESEEEWICKTCYKYISQAKIPLMSVGNGFSFKNLPDSLSALKPTDTEQRCCSPRILFMQLKQLGVGPPGENNQPIGLVTDTYAEEKSFPVLLAGIKRCSDETRQVPVRYTSICKAELRNVDGRFATSVTNMFFKLKKIQTLQIKDMASIALRKSKNLQIHRHSKSCKKKGKEVYRFGFPLSPMKETLILEPIDLNSNQNMVKMGNLHFKKIQKVIKSLEQQCEYMDCEEFFLRCELTYEKYIEAIQSTLKRKQVILKRSVCDVRVNAYNMQLLFIWQANSDLQFVLDPWAVCVYIASYIMKSQRGMSLLLQEAAEEARKGNFRLKDKVRLISNKFLNHCEVSTQEAVYLLLQLPLTQSSRNIIFINTSLPEKRVEILKPMSQIQHLPDSSTDVTCSAMIDKYCNRPEMLERVTLAEYAAYFVRRPPRVNETANEIDLNIDEMDNNMEDFIPGMDILLEDGYRLKKTVKPKVIRFVKFNIKKDRKLNYREQLMLFLPFRDEPQLMAESASFEQQYIVNQELIMKTQMKFQSTVDGIEDAMNIVTEEMIDEHLDDIAPIARQSEDDAHLIKDNELITNEEYITLASSLNKEQQLVFYEMLHKTKTGEGGAGVGKSHVLKTVYQALVRYFDRLPGENPDDMKIAIAAPTGKAVFNVRGNTLHSLFNIPPSRKLATYIPCDHSSLNNLRCQFQKLRILIIDEVTMQIFESNQPFARISLILVCDMFQLRPVGDSWIFQNDSRQYGPLMTNLWQDLVEMYELSTVMRQRNDEEFDPEQDIGSITRHKQRHLYRLNSTIDNSWTPILKVQKEFQVGKSNKARVVRKQFPLKPAEAITIHKSQGSTLDKAAVSFKGSIQKHMVYAALSRVRSLEDLCLLDTDAGKISVDVAVQQEMKRLRKDKMLQCEQDIGLGGKITVICHNGRSLHKHIDSYRNDQIINNADILIIQETLATKYDPLNHYYIEGFQNPLCVFSSNSRNVPTQALSYMLKSLILKGQALLSLLSIEKPAIIAGDFDIDHLQVPQCKKLTDMMNVMFHAKHVSLQSTTDFGTAIDQIYTNVPVNRSGVLETYWSDHKMVWAVL